MANQKTKIDIAQVRHVRSSPFSEEEWLAVIAELDLPPQQARIVRLVLQGMRNQQIAFTLHLSESTVRTYLSRIFQRLNVSDRLELALHIFTTIRQICPPADRHRLG